jgi:hypothetical protein
MPFPYRTALITGASAGFGVEFARQLAPHVDRLILLARRGDRLEALRAELARPGLQIECEVVDLADEASVEDFLARADGIDLVVNNAGLGDHGFFDEGDWLRVKPMLQVNIAALTRITLALLPPMVRARHGAILNVSSIASLMPVPQMTVYAATKAYVTSFTEGIRAETRRTGVRVSAVCPGPVLTEFFGKAERSANRKYHAPEFFQVTPETVVDTALRGLVRDRARTIPGPIVCAVMLLVGLVPIFLLRPFLTQRR